MKKLRRIPFTQEGLSQLKAKYEQFLSDRKQAVLNLKAARELGDLSENGLYKGARARLSSIDFNLKRMKRTITLADVVEKPEKGIVGIGSFVTIDDGKQERTFQIVGDTEANPSENKISQHSPLGSALIGKQEEDTTQVRTPQGNITYRVLRIK